MWLCYMPCEADAENTDVEQLLPQCKIPQNHLPPIMNLWSSWSHEREEKEVT